MNPLADLSMKFELPYSHNDLSFLNIMLDRGLASFSFLSSAVEKTSAIEMMDKFSHIFF